MKRGFQIMLAGLVLAFGVSSCAGDESADTNTPKKIEDAQAADNTNKEKTGAAAVSNDIPKTTIEFNEMEHHFGTIDEGDKVETIFMFTNTGSEDLILEKCKGSCGCTVPQCPKEPIPPGGTGEIKVVFNSKGKKNHQEKRVTVTANTENPQTVLKIIADVTPAPEEEGAATNPAKS